MIDKTTPEESGRWNVFKIGIAVFLGATAVVGLFWIGSASVQRKHSVQADSVSNVPLTFSKDIAPIVFNHCAPCHHPGQSAPFSLLSYSTGSISMIRLPKRTWNSYPRPGLCWKKGSSCASAFCLRSFAVVIASSLARINRSALTHLQPGCGPTAPNRAARAMFPHVTINPQWPAFRNGVTHTEYVHAWLPRSRRHPFAPRQ